MPVDDVLDDFDGFMNSTDHVEFYWVPHTRWALTKRNTRTQDPPAPRKRTKEYLDDVALTNGAFGLLCRLGRTWPRAITWSTTFTMKSGLPLVLRWRNGASSGARAESASRNAR